MRMRAALFALAVSLTVSPAPALPLPPPQPAFQGVTVELARHHRRHRKRHRHHGAASVGGSELMSELFWPLDVPGLDADDPGCALYGCPPGWTLGPAAWGLYGLGVADPLGLAERSR